MKLIGRRVGFEFILHSYVSVDVDNGCGVARI